MVVVVILAFGGFAAYILHSASKARDRRRDTLAEIARFLGGTSDAADGRAAGAVDGVATTIRFVTRGSGSDRESWTEIECALPRGYPLSLHVGSHGWFDRGKIERGELVDVVFDDPPFDEAFLVEGAPVEIVRRLLDADARRFLLGQRRATLETRDDGTLRLSIRGWLEAEHEVRPALRCAARLAAGVRAATASVDAAIPPAATDSPYRPMLDDAPVLEARAARAAEVEALDARRAERSARQKTLFAALAIGFVVIWLLAVLGD